MTNALIPDAATLDRVARITVLVDFLEEALIELEALELPLIARQLAPGVESLMVVLRSHTSAPKDDADFGMRPNST